MAGFLPPFGSLVGVLSAEVNSPASAPQAGTPAPWRPPQWANGSPALTMTATDPVTLNTTAYVFDSVMKIEHISPVVLTQNPVLTGANVNDHAYVLPAQVIVEIGMSDAMQSFSPTLWIDGPSRSVNAYQTLVAIRSALQPVQLSTRLNDYDNMLIANIRAEDDASTTYGLRAIITFEQVIFATLESSSSGLVGSSGTNPVSTVPQTTQSTVVGQVLPQSIPSAIQSQNSILNASSLGVALGTLPAIAGQGLWSSYPVGALSTVFPSTAV